MKAMTKQERIVRKRKILLAISIMFIVLVGASIFTVKSNASESQTVYKYYTSYQVKSGDTLWTIADQFLTPEHNDKKEYIREIKSLNHIEDGNINAGEFIVVAYYAYEEL